MYYSNNDVRLEEMPRPRAKDKEVLVRVMASGICGSDVMEWYRRNKVPLVLGHEIAGEVVEAGKGTRYNVGDRVAASHHVPCGSCRYCVNGHETACETLRKTNFYPGGFAEYVLLPPINVEKGVYALPDKVSYEEATFIEPLACILRAQRRAGLKRGQALLVIGSGISGLLHIALGRAKKAGLIVATDVNEYRMKAAKRFGADLVVNGKDDVPARLREANSGRTADCVIVTTGSVKAIGEAMKCVDRGGTLLFFAPTDEGVTIPLSINDFFWRNDTTIATSYAGSPEDHLEALRLIGSGEVKLRDMITHRLPLAEAQKGFKLVAQGGESIKVIVEPQK
ncbi:MAG: alcohol dehydrogenase catalytic domain-containing protein [Candidatus Omnitrophica bacterium]|nr:alcohol dehydrogenase catalytic domain-containing protein [Candidatus Omnitrophota bacterium]